MNKLKKIIFSIAVVMLTGMSAVSPAFASGNSDSLTPIPDKPSQLYVADEAGVFNNNGKSHMYKMLSDYEKKTHNKIYILMVNSTGDELFEQYSKRAAKKWDIPNSRHTILITLSAIDYQTHVEVSKDLQKVITPERASRMASSHDVTYSFNHRETNCSYGTWTTNNSYYYGNNTATDNGYYYGYSTWCSDTGSYIHDWYSGMETLVSQVQNCIKTNGRSADMPFIYNHPVFFIFCAILVIFVIVSIIYLKFA